MGKREIQHVTIIGVGLLGGSIGLSLRRRYPGVRIAGVGRRKSSLAAAKKRGCIDTAHFDIAEAASGSDLVILATPVGFFETALRQLKPALADGALVTDVGSTKAVVVRAAERILGRGGPFVGSHPMGGNENKGPQFAEADLLTGALCIVTPTNNTPPANVKRVEQLWRALDMRTTRLSPADHDRAVARVSHLPHVLASLMMMLPDDQDLPLSATGLRDTTRLAGGDPEMWRDILTTNRKAILAAMDKYARDMKKFRDLVADDTGSRLEKFFTKAKNRRDTTIGKK